MNLEAVAEKHAKELNKSIYKIAQNTLYGLLFIGGCLYFALKK